MTNPANLNFLDFALPSAALSLGLPGLAAFGASKFIPPAMGQGAPKPRMAGERVLASRELPEPEKAPPLNLPSEPPIPGGGTSFPVEVDKGQKIEDPNLAEILKILRNTTDPATVSRIEDDRLRRILTASDALSRESRLKGEEISRRQESIKRIEQWGAIEQTRLAANAVGMTTFAQALYLAGVPNVNVTDAMARGTQAALAPFQFKLGGRT